ncbi:P-loop NTPase [Candidatus Magnetominusculus xianensis]|uniref:ATP-binding protein n=1 Tax=Candidatus Magnetominusculus xianensis TaxID=1748249 RepID=A0ABR5SMM0_9BACT|nr:P-loop NTPase [Candidatus Magnetominusculus xianensis]KWT92024.1 ATP-binding protein [Candidatus Magnetominusculus xianensis]MBF0405242.1 P-loop NTPase [Nitrospirota bacterium]
MAAQRKARHILAVAGGKGGVGKSVFSITLATTLVGMGYRVVLIDLDLGGANLHTYMGILGQTLSLSHFFQKKVKTLDEVVISTRVPELKLISGAHYLPSMSSPGSSLKIKLLRHIKALDADFIVIDLGAGMDLNTMDFFISSDIGFIVTVAEPAAIMNSYRFIKGTLFRKLHGVFKNHAQLAPILVSMAEDSAYSDSLMLNTFIEKVMQIDPSAYPLVNEISAEFRPCLVLNRIGTVESNNLVGSLISHCTTKYNVQLKYLGNLPHVKEISSFLLDIPAFLRSSSGSGFFKSLKSIVRKFLLDIHDTNVVAEKLQLLKVYDDDTIKRIGEIIKDLPEGKLTQTEKKLWQLRLYFKPTEVVAFLLCKGIKDNIFFEQLYTIE